MKKIIVAFDGLTFSESALQYALYVSRQMQAHLVGVFMEDVLRHSYSVSQVTHYEGDFDQHVRQLDHQDRQVQAGAVHRFTEACTDAGISFGVHRDRNVALQELLHESIYADLLIIDRKETMSRFDEIPPTRFVRDLLADIQCPALVVPSAFRPIEKTVLLYDGEPSSVYAIKMFNYLLGGGGQEVEVITVHEKEGAAPWPDKHLVQEFIRQHHPQAGFVSLQGQPDATLVHHLGKEQAALLLVLGAYRRSRMSRVFRPSMADMLINHLEYPLFIAHNK